MLPYLRRFYPPAFDRYIEPAGRYEHPKIADREKLARVADALSSARLRLVWGGFESVLELAAPGDFVYFDPPYAPVSRTANFTSYIARRFGPEDQRRLQQIVIALATRGCSVLLSNSTGGEITALYEHSEEARAAGLRAIRVPARRAINSNAAQRGMVDEYLISNIGPGGSALT